MTHYSLEHSKCFSFINKMFPNNVFIWKNISIYQKVTHHLVHSAANLVAIHRCWQLGNQDCPASPVQASLDQHGLYFFFFLFFFSMDFKWWKGPGPSGARAHNKMGEPGFGNALSAPRILSVLSCLSRVLYISECLILSRDENQQVTKGLR